MTEYDTIINENIKYMLDKNRGGKMFQYCVEGSMAMQRFSVKEARFHGSK